MLVSDLLAPVEALETSLALLTASGHEVLVFQVLDPAERTFDFAAASRFRGSGNAAATSSSNPPWRAPNTCGVSPRMATAVRAICQRLGISHHTLATDQPLELALFDFLKGRAARGKTAVRRKAGV